MSNDFCALTATQLVDGYRTHQFSPVEVARAVLERIEQLNPVLNAFYRLSLRFMKRCTRAAPAPLARFLRASS